MQQIQDPRRKFYERYQFVYPNLLAEPGFEETPTTWFLTAGECAVSGATIISSVQRTGLLCLQCSASLIGPRCAMALRQVTGLQIGKTYQFRGYYKTFFPWTGNRHLEMRIYNASQMGLIACATLLVPVTGSYQPTPVAQFVATKSSCWPAVFFGSPTQTIGGSVCYIDDLYFQESPA